VGQEGGAFGGDVARRCFFQQMFQVLGLKAGAQVLLVNVHVVVFIGRR
jgi:hypothetical protein